MAGEARALLVTGPGGSGKSTLAAAVAERLGWALLSEDEHWVRNGWGSGPRTAEHEREVQAQVAADLLAAVQGGSATVLGLILYALPPNPLTAYQDVLDRAGVAHVTVVLKPSVEEVVRRMERRGRPSDLADLDRRRRDAEWQVGILGPGVVDPAWVVDPTGLSVDDLCDECVARLGRG